MRIREKKGFKSVIKFGKTTVFVVCYEVTGRGVDVSCCDVISHGHVDTWTVAGLTSCCLKRHPIP